MRRTDPQREYTDEGDGPAAERRDDDRTLPYFVPFGWPTVFDRGEERYDEQADGDENYGDASDRVGEDDGSWLDEGLITLTILAGVVLFLFPEPATSGLGVLLMAVGVVAWLVDWAT